MDEGLLKAIERGLRPLAGAMEKHLCGNHADKLAYHQFVADAPALILEALLVSGAVVRPKEQADWPVTATVYEFDDMRFLQQMDISIRVGDQIFGYRTKHPHRLSAKSRDDQEYLIFAAKDATGAALAAVTDQLTEEVVKAVAEALKRPTPLPKERARA